MNGLVMTLKNGLVMTLEEDKIFLSVWLLILSILSLQTGSPYGLFRDLLSNS